MNKAIKDRRVPLNGQLSWAVDRRNHTTHVVVSLDRRNAIADRRRMMANEALGLSDTYYSVPVQSIKRQISELADFEQLQQVLQSTQLELKLSRERYRELYEISPISYVTLSISGSIVDINPSAIHLLGLEGEKFYHLPFARFLEKQEDEGWSNLLSKLFNGEGRNCVETVLKSAKGLVFQARLDCLRQTIAAEASILLVAIANISACKLPENQLGLSVSVFDIEEGVMVTSPQMIILQVNRAFTRITDYRCEEVVGRAPHFLHSALQSDGFYQKMWQSIHTQGYWQGESWNRRKNGEVYPEWLAISTIKDARGQVIYYVSSFLDISSRPKIKKNTLQSHRELGRQLQQKNAELQKNRVELGVVNTALKVLVKHQETEHSGVKEELEQEIKREIMPLLLQLKQSNHDDRQLALLQILDANLQNIVSSYGRSHSMVRVYQELTPKEIQVASMIREGLSTKHIANTLSSSIETVNVHRKNIRKKLGLDNKPVNLRTFLNSYE